MSSPGRCLETGRRSDTGRRCKKCGQGINPGRLLALPGAVTCVGCSDTGRWYVRNVISGKTTYCETEVIKDANAAESIRKMDKRTGWGSNLYKSRG